MILKIGVDLMLFMGPFIKQVILLLNFLYEIISRVAKENDSHKSARIDDFGNNYVNSSKISPQKISSHTKRIQVEILFFITDLNYLC
jgi:hypothetical protein